MKNLFKAAFCFAIKDDVRIVKEEHITQAAKAVFYHKSTKITENLPMDFSFFEDSIENGKGIEFCKIENIFEEFDSIKDLPKLSKEVKAFQNKMKKLNFNLETQNVVFVSEKDYKNFSIKDFKKKLEEKTKTDILKEAKEVKEFLLTKLFGQEMAINSVYDSLKNNISNDGKKPKQIYFFLGPPGVGKTYLAELMSKIIKGYTKYKTFDMGQFQNENDGIQLYGTARGYNNMKVGVLTSFVKENPKSIIIFDEFEKANVVIQNSLLPIFSAGYLKDTCGWNPNGRPYSNSNSCEENEIIDIVDFSQTIVIITSNLGGELYSDDKFLELLKTDLELAEDMIIDTLKREKRVNSDEKVAAISAPLLSRFTQANIALFNKLYFDDLLKIANESFDSYFKAFKKEFNLGLKFKANKNELIKLLLLQFSPDFDIRRIKSKLGISFFDKITDYIINNNFEVKSFENISINILEEVLTFIKEKIDISNSEKRLDKELFIKNQTLQFEFEIKNIDKELIINITEANFKRVERIKDYQGKSALRFEMPEKSFDDIAGHAIAKSRLKEIVNLLKNKDTIKEFNIKLPKGVLLYGPSGTGKTMLAGAIAKEANLPFISTSANDLINTENLIKDIFTKAKEYSPSIIFIDEIDIFEHRGNNSFLSSKVNELLIYLDGLDSCEDVFVIGATNIKDKIDNAILRAGRIDIHICIDSLDKEARKFFIEEIILKDSKAEVNIENLLLYTTEMNGSDLEKLKRESFLFAVRHGLKDISEEILIEQINTIKYGEKITSLSIKEILEETAYHEAGHAIISKILMPQIKITQITITPRGKSLGFVSFSNEDKYSNLTREDIKNKISVLLAGRLSQLHKYGKISGYDTGASDDLSQVMNYCYKAIAHYGMDEDVGNINIHEFEDKKFFQTDIENAIKKWIKDAETKTTDLIKDNWHLIERLAKKLLEDEVVDENSLICLIKEK